MGGAENTLFEAATLARGSHSYRIEHEGRLYPRHARRQRLCADESAPRAITYLLSPILPREVGDPPHSAATLTVERETGHPQQTGHAKWVVELLTLLMQSLAHSSYRGESAV